MCDLEMTHCINPNAQQIVEFNVSITLWPKFGAVKLEEANAWR